MERLTVKEPTMGYYYSGYSTSDIINRLAYYEDLEEQGLLLKVPCKVGDIIWCIENFACDGTLINPPRIREAKFNHHLLEFVGKTVFLTKEEAEEALRKKVDE